MNDEIADSGEAIDMDAAMEEISADLFPEKEEPKEEFDVVEEIIEEVEEPKEKEEPEEAKEPEGKPAPQSWKKEMHEFWKGLDPTVQSYVEQREEQMREGLEKDRGDANIGRTVRDIMAPYQHIFTSQGIDPTQMIGNLTNAHIRLSTAPQEEKLGLIKQIAQSYNISLNGEAPQVDPVLQAMQSKVNNLEQYLTATQQRAKEVEQQEIKEQVEEFISDPAHEFFDEVSAEIVDFVNNGHSLEDAYALALRANPITYQKEMDRQIKEAVEKAQTEWKAESEKAKKAKLANVRSRDTARVPTEPTGTMDDTMREIYREIQSR